MCKCQRCGKELKSEESKKRGYGPTCFKIVSFQKNKKWRLKFRKGLNTLKYRKKREIVIQNIINTPPAPEKVSVDNNDIQDLSDRMRKIELDNAYLKARDKNRTATFINADPHDTNLERIKREEAAKITDPILQQYKNVFNECVKDLKEALKQGSDYLKERKEYEPEITREPSLAELKNKHKSLYIDVQDLKIVRE